MGINAIAKRPLFQNTYLSLFGGMKGLLLTLLKRRLLNLFWPLMRKKRQSEEKFHQRRDQRA
jgi:hypothetical protein